MTRESANVLVVEDEGILAIGLKQTLQKLGYGVPGIAASGKEALETMGEHHVDLVLMDIVLRGPMDGIDTAIELRSRFDIPILYLTAYADEETIERAKPTEPYGYLVKPFKERDLHISIEMALNKYAREKQRIATAPGSPLPRQLEMSTGEAAKVFEAAMNLGYSRGLTKTELRILSLLASGFSQSSIALVQHRSINTVKTHLRNIYQKLHIKGQSDLFRTTF